MIDSRLVGPVYGRDFEVTVVAAGLQGVHTASTGLGRSWIPVGSQGLINIGALITPGSSSCLYV